MHGWTNTTRNLKPRPQSRLNTPPFIHSTDNVWCWGHSIPRVHTCRRLLDGEKEKESEPVMP